MPNILIPAAAKGMPLVNETPWDAARRLGKELSEVLAKCGNGQSYALIMPAGIEYAVGFSAIGAAPDEHPISKTERLGAELADALNGYMDQGYHCEIYPASKSGHSVFFRQD